MDALTILNAIPVRMDVIKESVFVPLNASMDAMQPENASGPMTAQHHAQMAVLMKIIFLRNFGMDMMKIITTYIKNTQKKIGITMSPGIIVMKQRMHVLINTSVIITARQSLLLNSLLDAARLHLTAPILFIIAHTKNATVGGIK